METEIKFPPLFAGVRAENKAALLTLPRGGVSFAFGGNPAPPELFIAMPCCGEVRSWMHLEDVPERDVGPCRCGNWFIKYGPFAGERS